MDTVSLLHIYLSNVRSSENFLEIIQLHRWARQTLLVSTGVAEIMTVSRVSKPRAHTH